MNKSELLVNVSPTKLPKNGNPFENFINDFSSSYLALKASSNNARTKYISKNSSNFC